MMYFQVFLLLLGVLTVPSGADFSKDLYNQLKAENKVLVAYYYSPLWEWSVPISNTSTPKYIYYIVADGTHVAAQPTLSELQTARKSLPKIVKLVQERVAQQHLDCAMDSIMIGSIHDDPSRSFLLFYPSSQGSGEVELNHDSRMHQLRDGSTLLQPVKCEGVKFDLRITHRRTGAAFLKPMIFALWDGTLLEVVKREITSRDYMDMEMKEIRDEQRAAPKTHTP